MSRRAAARAGLAAALLAATAPSPASAGPPYLTDDPEPVAYGHWEIYGFATGTVVRGNSAGFLPATEVNYGALPDLQLHLTVPAAYNSQSIIGGTAYGIGDIEFGAKYRLVDPGEADWWPEIAIYPAYFVPTGSARLNLGTGRAHAFLPVWLQKDFGKWRTYGGAGYWINPGPGNKNFWFAGWLLQRQVTDRLAIGGELFHQTVSLTGGPGSAGFPLGSQDTTGFNLGAVYDLTEHYHLLVSAGRGLENVAASDEFSYYLALQWTF